MSQLAHCVIAQHPLDEVAQLFDLLASALRQLHLVDRDTLGEGPYSINNTLAAQDLTWHPQGKGALSISSAAFILSGMRVPKIPMRRRGSGSQLSRTPWTDCSFYWSPINKTLCCGVRVRAWWCAPSRRAKCLLRLNPSSPPRTGQTALPWQTERFRVLAHVAGRGDVYAQPNAWVAGPTSPSRIEGLALEWLSKPVGIDVTYSVRTGKPHAVSGRMCAAGAFAGTRGHALPLTGVLFELSGPDAPNHNLVAEALFLGSPVARNSGRRIVVSGATGREPLVGLRLSIEPNYPATASIDPATASARAATSSQPATTPAASSAPNTGRVRVFRGRSRTAAHQTNSTSRDVV